MKRWVYVLVICQKNERKKRFTAIDSHLYNNNNSFTVILIYNEHNGKARIQWKCSKNPFKTNSTFKILIFFIYSRNKCLYFVEK